MVTSSVRGHGIYYDGHVWRYINDNSPIHEKERPCKRCGRMPTPEGYDACLGHVEGATSACCGHGIEEPCLVLESGRHVRLFI